MSGGAWAKLSRSTLQVIADGLRTRSTAPTTWDLQRWGVADADAAAIDEAMHGVSVAGWRATVAAVLAERRASRRVRPQVVWSGPRSKDATARATTEVVRELLSGAQREVWVVGYAFKGGAPLFAPLFDAVRERGVTVHFVVHLKRDESSGWPRALTQQDVDAGIAAIRSELDLEGLAVHWYYEARVTEADARFTSLHAKVLAVDDRRMLLSSANFTARAQDRNLEIGVLHDEPELVTSVTAHFRASVREGVWVQWRGEVGQS